MALFLIVFPTSLVCDSSGFVDNFSLFLPFVSKKTSHVFISICTSVFSLTLYSVLNEASLVTISVDKYQTSERWILESFFELSFISIAVLQLNSFSLLLVIFPISLVLVQIIFILDSKTISFWLYPLTFIVSPSFLHVFALSMFLIFFPVSFICRPIYSWNIYSFSLLEFVNEVSFVCVPVFIAILSLACYFTFFELSNIGLL